MSPSNENAPDVKASDEKPPVTGEEIPYPATWYAWYVVFILMLIYVNSFMDRQILGLLVEPIKRDLDINEKQMSYLMGISFAVFYTVMGIPLGRLVDYTSRRWLIGIGQVFWSICSGGCGIAQNYMQFLAFRMGVGVGEATLSPSAYSMITDYFPRKRLATAISVYSMGIYIGSGLAYLIGAKVIGFASTQDAWDIGFLGQVRPWQLVFFFIAAPVIPLTLMLFTVKEPVRRGVLQVKNLKGKMTTAKTPLGEVFAYIKQNKFTFACHNLGFALLAFSAYGATSWIPTHFIRSYDMAAGDVGWIYGWIVMIAGTLGIVTGGMCADKLTKMGFRDGKMRMGMIAALSWIPFGVSYPLMQDSTLSFILMTPSVFFTSMSFGVAPAAIQEMMPNTMRGQASAIYLFVINLIGLGLGPTAVAFITEDVFKDLSKISESLIVVTFSANIVAALLLFIGLKHYRTSLDFLEAWQAKQPTQ